jgi:hypothetical protein
MTNLLLPYRWKYVGWLLTLSGMFLTILYSWFNFRFVIHAFAVYSSFLETKMFTSIRTNFSDELIMIMLICGLGLIIFSREKVEHEYLNSIRINSLAKALITNIVFLILSILFIFGSAFINILVINVFSFPLLYLLFFYYRKWKEKNSREVEN